MDEGFLLAYIAKMHYIDNVTQKEIANNLKLSPIQVSRYLKEAILKEIVSFHIKFPIDLDVELGLYLKKKYNLKDCLVIEDNGEAEKFYYSDFSNYIASYINMLLNDKSILGVSWGHGLYEIIKELPYRNLPNLKILQISGGFFSENNYMVTPSHIVKDASNKLNAIPIFLNAPFFSSDLEMKESLQNDLSIMKTFEIAKKADINVIGASPLSSESTISSSGVINNQDIKELRSLGAIGDIGGFFIDKNGEFLNWSKSDFYTGIPIEIISKADSTILVVLEARKEEVLKAIIDKPFYNILFTSKSLANKLI